ncbi:Uncharacterised protein [Segatella copri]|nr:Uncharacterised protein [Segatella copri]
MLAFQFSILLIEFLVCLAEGLTDIALSLLKHLLLTVDQNLVFQLFRLKLTVRDRTEGLLIVKVLLKFCALMLILLTFLINSLGVLY